MGKMSCFAGLLGGGRNKASKGKNKGVYAKRINGNDCPKVKPVEFMDMADTVDVITRREHNVPAAACDSKFGVVPAPAELTPHGGQSCDKAAVKRRSSRADLVAGGSSGYSSDRTGKSPKTTSPDAGESSSVGRMSSPTPTPSPKLKRSCSNIETTTTRSSAPPSKVFDLPAKSPSYNDLNAMPPARSRSPTTPSAGEEDTFPSQWVAFSTEDSPLDRVSAWVNSLGDDGSFHHHAAAVDEDDDATEHGGAARPSPCSEIVEVEVPTTAAGKIRQQAVKRRAAEEVANTNNQASGVVHTLNVFSSVAHISGMGFKAVPPIAAFSTLRAVNLSGNMIVQITPGSLPKGLHSLDLSRNKIAVIEGLRELTRLRVLNLSYNRISRIGRGLSGCTSIRELYLAGNKISDVEGLHRLLKLAVLDVSFNKVTTARSLGQLVANYASLRALNLLGNPVQAATGDDTLRRAVSGLLPKIEYLNRQPIKPQRAREAAKDSVARAALAGNGGGGGWSSRRRTAARRVTQSPGASSHKGRGRDGGSSRRGSRSRSKTRLQGTSSSISRR
nr:unnamed protein product [Digitaria exilis]